MPLPPPPPGYEKLVPRCEEAPELVTIGLDAYGRELALAPAAGRAWHAMRDASRGDGVQLLLLSGFRSVQRQHDIVQRKLAAGMVLDAILRENAYPGFSEHHTGRAIDFGSPDAEHFTENFDATREFAWLRANAARFGFSLSYPRDNPHGIVYEPWHWCWRQSQR